MCTQGFDAALALESSLSLLSAAMLPGVYSARDPWRGGFVPLSAFFKFSLAETLKHVCDLLKLCDRKLREQTNFYHNRSNRTLLQRSIFDSIQADNRVRGFREKEWVFPRR